MRKREEKIRMFEGKKCELAIDHVIIITILIIGFGILAFFYYNFFWTGVIDSQACHTSVVLRGSLSSISSFGEGYVPLKCKTNKICITSGLFGSTCSIFSGISGISRVKVKGIEQIEKAIANEVVNCWGMMGEGKLDLFTQAAANRWGFDKVYPSCVICSRISLDMKGLKLTSEQIKDIDVESYMRTREMPGTNMTYYDYLSGGNAPITFDEEKLQKVISNIANAIQVENGVAENNCNGFSLAGNALNYEGKDTGIIFESPVGNQLGDIKKGDNILGKYGPARQILSVTSDEKISIDGKEVMLSELNKCLLTLDGKLIVKAEISVDKDSIISDASTSSEIGILFMQISAPSHTGVIKNTIGDIGKFALVPAVLAPGTTLNIGKACFTNVYCAAGAGIIAAIAGITQQGMTFWNRGVAMGYCGDVKTGGEAREGCSSVKVVSYDKEGIEKYCLAIESIP
jgi:hypothetical protein